MQRYLLHNQQPFLVESDSEGTTTQQSMIDADAIATNTEPTNKVRWASLYTCDVDVENMSEDESDSLDGINLRRSTLLIHISPDNNCQN